MTFRELPARPRLQIALEVNGPLLIRELDHDVKVPRPMTGRVRTPTSVVVFQPAIKIRREADVEAWALALVSQHIDNVFVRHCRPREQAAYRTAERKGWPDSLS